MKNCIVCETESHIYYTDEPSRRWTDCPRCGMFAVSDDGRAEKRISNLNEYQKGVLSYWIRQQTEGGRQETIGDELIVKIIQETSLPDPREQGDNLIRYLG